MTSEAAASSLQQLIETLDSVDPRAWHLLGILACERRVATAALERVAPSTADDGDHFVLRRWLDTSVAAGLLVEAGVVYGLAAARSAGGERAFALAPGYRPLILRRMAGAGELPAILRDAQRLLADGSIAAAIVAIYGGDVGALPAAVAALRGKIPNGEDAAFARRLLRESICAPFDAQFLERTWRQLAPRVAQQILSDTLVELDAVEGLYAWAVTTLARDAQRELSAAFARVVAEHALLRGDGATLQLATGRLGLREAFAFSAAARYATGDLPSARAALADAFESARGGERKALHAGAAAPLLALLALDSDAPGETATVKALMRAPLREAPLLPGFEASSALPAAQRALRVLLRSLKQTDEARRDPSPHQLPQHTAAWELLLLGLDVALHSDTELARAAWARRLANSAGRWQRAGYEWLARQGQALAHALHAEIAAQSGAFTPRPRELYLVDLLRARPAWQKALDALSSFAEEAARPAKVVALRVAWFVDMTRAELARPVLEEFRPESGWSRGHRSSADELYALRDELPPEDVAVLATGQRVGKEWQLNEAAFEALCGHPRVFNGARGRLPVEVVRSICRIETRREHGHLIIQVEPRGAHEGVNLVVQSESRLLVCRVTPLLAKLFQLLPLGARVPLSHERDALEVLARLAGHVELRSATPDARRAVPADSTPCLRISPSAGALWLEAGVRPFGAGGRFLPPGLGRRKLTAHVEGELLDCERDLELEQRRFDELLAHAPSLASALASERQTAGARDNPFSTAMGEEGLFALLSELRESGLQCALEWQNTRPVHARGRLGAKDLKGAVRRVKGWYIATGQLSLDAVTRVDLAALLEMPFTRGGRFIRLPSGDFLELEARVQRALQALKLHAVRGERPGELRLSDAALSALESLLQPGSGFEADASVLEWRAFVEATSSREYAVPEALRATLRPYQAEGYEWLCRFSELGLGVCLADDMGLGKTLQVLGLLLRRVQGGPALVVAPTSVCSNWLREIERFAPSLLAVEYVGKHRAALLERCAEQEQPAPEQRRPDVLIASYALLQQDREALSRVTWNTLVLDEAQFIKNADSLRARAAAALRSRYRLAMTGTPLENHLGDLFSIFHFLNPGLLGSWQDFRARYMKPVEQDGDSEPGEALKRLIQPFILRRSKQQVATDLPPITTVDHEVRLSEDEALRYTLLRRQIHEKLRTPHGRREHKLRIFAEIMRLRRFCCHPRLVFPEASEECSKLDAFLELAEELADNGHRALVFSQFVDFLHIAAERLTERGIAHLYLDGSTPKTARSARVAAFQAGEAPLFLVSLKAGGFGLNLTGADYVIHLDPWWNPAVEAQATDRAHRIGQTRPVTVYRLVTKDTIEEQILELHREKRALAEALLAGSDVASRLSVEELGALLGVSESSQPHEPMP